MVAVSSEIGRLRRVLIHEPGPEVDRMVPAMMEQSLFDDILYGDRARDEHGQFRRVLQLYGIEVIDASDLLREALEDEAARRWIRDVVLQELSHEDRLALERLTTEELAATLVAGSRSKPRPAGVEIEDLYEIPPLPNWCFQRDPQVILGGGVVFCSMATSARHREALLARTIFRFHPELRSVPVLFDPIEADRSQPLFVEKQWPTLEGGDVLVLSPDLLAVGLSERTNGVAVRQLARSLARRDGGPRWLLAVAIPRRRAYMHLDTLITPVDRDACLVYAPVILEGGPDEARVFEIDLHARDPVLAPTGPLLHRLAEHGLDYEPIPCGGDDPIAQQREQWTDGANALALGPGTITLYDRNTATAEELDRHGFRVVAAKDLLLGREETEIDSSNRVAVLLPSHEISRARGGPHCLVHPLERDDGAV